MASSNRKMRILCFPGAFGSAKNFEVQLAPFCKEFTQDGSAEFFFTQGKNPCSPPAKFLDYFGPAPHYRFFDYDGLQQNDVLERVRDFPEGENAEDVLRELMPDGYEEVTENVLQALASVYETIEEHGPFDGVAAYSEGAVMAGTLILDELKRFQQEGRERQIKFAIFFAGWPPLKPAESEIVLSDTSEAVIDIPTVHVVGADDPYLDGAMALYNVCDPDNAILFDHGKGHTIPRDAPTLKELGDTIKRMGREATAPATS